MPNETLMKRLRDAGNDYTIAWGSGELYDEAAEEIERLKAELERIKTGIGADRCDGDSEWAAGVNAACDNHRALVAAGAKELPAGHWLCVCGMVLKGGKTHMNCPAAPPPHAQSMTDEALSIADAAMWEQFLSSRHGGKDNCYAFPGPDDMDSDPAHQAVRWLQRRGYVKLEQDDAGDYARAVKEPGSTIGGLAPAPGTLNCAARGEEECLAYGACGEAGRCVRATCGGKGPDHG